jgi:GNAT superfamily N-acetyltransferase
MSTGPKTSRGASASLTAAVNGPPGVRYRFVDGLDAEGYGPYEELTYPSLRAHWEASRSREELVGVLAEVGGVAAGLAVAQPYDESAGGTVQSLFVRPDQRRQGIGAGLLAWLGERLEARGIRQVDVRYMDTELTSESMAPLLARCGWSPPETWMVFCRSEIRTVAEAPWVVRTPGLPEDFSIFPWAELSSEEREDILLRQRERPWYPEDLGPFLDEALIEPINSVGLRHRGRVVGWLSTHRVAADTIRYTTLFVARHHQRMARGVALMAEAVRRHATSCVPYGACAVNWENPGMSVFVCRRLLPHVQSATEVRRASKQPPPAHESGT